MKILVRATNWVGDAVMCIPALEAIRAHWPQAEIAILARPWVGDLYRGQGYADRLLALEPPENGLAGALRREQFDLAILLPNSFAAAWLAWRAGIRERVGYARDARRWLLTRAIPAPRNGETPRHEAYYYLELLRRAGWLAHLPRVEKIRLRVGQGALDGAEETLRRAGVPADSFPGVPRRRCRVALAPGAAYGSAKCWLEDRYASVCDRLIGEFDADVIIFGATSEREIASRIATGMRHRAFNLAGQTAIGDLPALLASCDLFVGNDSGAMHVAAAVGLPTVAIFGPTDPEGTGPVTPRRTIVQQRVWCSPCFLRHCPIDHRCMTRVEVDTVYSAVREWLQEGNQGRGRG